MATLASEIHSSAPGPTAAALASTSRVRSATSTSTPPGVPSVFTRARPDRSVRAARGDDFGDVVFGDGKAGHPGHGIFELALGVDDLETDPVDR